jgi:hypothetical protein
MEFFIWVETRIAGRTADIRQVAMVDRPAGIKAAEEIGLSLADGKTIIGQVHPKCPVRTTIYAGQKSPLNQCVAMLYP